jgi:tight adherence protein C
MEIFSTINEAVHNVLGPLGPIIIAGALGLIMVALTIVMMLRQPEDPMEKLKRTDSGKPQNGDKREKLRQGGHNQQLDKFASFLEPKDVAELSKRQLELRQAGYQSKDAVRFFHFAQMSLGLIGLVAGVIYVNFFLNTGDAEVSTQKLMMYTVGPGGIGYYLPQYWITRRV